MELAADPARDTAMRGPLAFALLAAVGIVQARERVVLPGSPLSAAVPSGWSCDADSFVAVGDEVLPVLTCLPLEGGSPVSLRRMGRDEAPPSLEAFLSSERERMSSTSSKNVVVAPRMTSLAGRDTVESAFRNQGIVHGVDGSVGEMEMIAHAFTFDHDGAFFQCQLDVSPGLNDDKLHKVFLEFCSSVAVAPAGAPHGHS